MRCIALIPVCSLLLVLPALGADGPAGVKDDRFDRRALRLRGKDVPVNVRKIITGYDNPAAVIDLGGQLFAGDSGTVLTLRPFDETCKIDRVDSGKNLVALQHPGYAPPRKTLKVTPLTEPSLDWCTVHRGLSASLTAAQREFSSFGGVLFAAYIDRQLNCSTNTGHIALGS
jgi:hypothetical protein